MNKKIISVVFQSAMISAAAVVFYAAVLKPWAVFEIPVLKAHDFFPQIRHRISPKPEILNQIVLVSIDNESVARLKERWPFRRSVYAELISRLNAAGAKLIALDFVFAGKSTPDEDFLLAEAIRQSGKVILASFVDPDGHYIPPLPDMNQSAVASGIVNKLADRDRIVRRLGLFYVDGNQHPVSWPWEIAVAGNILEMDLEQYEQTEGRVFFPFKDAEGKYAVPEYPKGLMDINYRITLADVKQIPFWKIFETGTWEPGVKGKIVLVGATSKIIHDEYETPLGLMPGIVINVNVIQNLLDRDFLRQIPGSAGILIAAVFVFAASVCALSFGVLTAFFWMWVWTAGWALAAYVLFAKNHLPDFFTPLISGWAVFFGVGFYRYVRTLIENFQLRRRVATDPLTGLANRRTLEGRIDEELANLAQTQTRRKTDFGDELSILMMDIDNFKSINDTFGHVVGDDVIKNVAYAIQSNVRGRDMGARYGGEEFCVVLPHTAKVEALRIAEKIRQMVEEKKLSYVNQLTSVTISVGVASSREDGFSASRALIHGADQALYDAKHSGKNRVSLYRHELGKESK